MVTVDAVRRGPWSVVHFDCSDYWQRNMISNEFRGLVVVDRGPRRARGRKKAVERERLIYFGGERFETLEAVTAAINQKVEHERIMSREWMKTGVWFTAMLDGERRGFVVVEPMLDRPGWLCRLIDTPQPRTVPSDQLEYAIPAEETVR